MFLAWCRSAHISPGLKLFVRNSSLSERKDCRAEPILLVHASVVCRTPLRSSKQGIQLCLALHCLKASQSKRQSFDTSLGFFLHFTALHITSRWSYRHLLVRIFGWLPHSLVDVWPPRFWSPSKQSFADTPVPQLRHLTDPHTRPYSPVSREAVFGGTGSVRLHTSCMR